MRTESKRESFNVSNNIHNVSRTKRKYLLLLYSMLCNCAFLHSASLRVKLPFISCFQQRMQEELFSCLFALLFHKANKKCAPATSETI